MSANPLLTARQPIGPDVTGRSSLAGDTPAIYGGPAASWIEIADLDGDASPEILTGSLDGLHVGRVRDGRPGLPTLVPTAIGAPSFTPTDLDGDGDIDVLVFDRMLRSQILTNDGAGAFSISPPWDLMAEAGLDPDLPEGDVLLRRAGVVRSIGPGAAQSSWRSEVLLPTPIGLLSVPIALDGTVGMLSIVDDRPAQEVQTADVNGDGHDDALVLADGFPAAVVRVAVSDPDGTLGSLVDIVGTNTPVFGVGDLDADGDVDLLTVGASPGTLAFAAGQGDGAFDPAVTIGTGLVAFPNAPYRIDVADLDGDGLLDASVQVPEFNGLGNASHVLLRGRRDAPPEMWARVTNGSVGGRTRLADVSGDGRTDIVSAVGGPRAGVTVMLGRADGPPGNGVRIGTDDPDGWWSMVRAIDSDPPALLRQDGLDLSIVPLRTGGTLDPLVPLGTGMLFTALLPPAVPVPGTESWQIVYPRIGEPFGLHVVTWDGVEVVEQTMFDLPELGGLQATLADLDANGVLDVFALAPDADRLLGWRIDGGELSPLGLPTTPGWFGPIRYALADDVNGDGRTDLVAFGEDAGVGVHWGEQDGWSALQTLGASAQSSKYRLVLIDADGDGLLDIVAATSLEDSQGAVVLRQISARRFIAAQELPFPPQQHSGHPGTATDLDGDGDEDLVPYRLVGGDLPWWWENRSTVGAVQYVLRPEPLWRGGGIEPVFVADVDQDGRTDVGFANVERLDVFRLSPSVPCIADLDADGRVGFADLLALLPFLGFVHGPSDLLIPGDLNLDRRCDVHDVIMLFAAWGPCGGQS